MVAHQRLTIKRVIIKGITWLLLGLMGLLLTQSILAEDFLLPISSVSEHANSRLVLKNFSSPVYIRDKSGNNIAVVQTDSIMLSEGTYELATITAELGQVALKENSELVIDAHDQVAHVYIKNITDKIHIYQKSNWLKIKYNNTQEPREGYLHTFYSGDQAIQLNFGEYQLIVDGNNNNQNKIDFSVKPNTINEIDLKSYFSYLDIPTSYTDGKIMRKGSYERIKCCTLIPGNYQVEIDDQNVGDFTLKAGDNYRLDPRASMATFDVGKPMNLKMTGQGFEHRFNYFPPKTKVSVLPGKYTLSYSYFNQRMMQRYEKPVADIELLAGESIRFEPKKYFAELKLNHIAKTKNQSFRIRYKGEAESVGLSDQYFPEGDYQLLYANRVLSDVKLIKGELTEIDMRPFYGVVQVTNSTRNYFYVYHKETQKYLDTIRPHKLNNSMFLIAGNYQLREKNNPHNGSIGNIITSFTVTAGDTIVLDFSKIVDEALASHGISPSQKN